MVLYILWKGVVWYSTIHNTLYKGVLLHPTVQYHTCQCTPKVGLHGRNGLSLPQYVHTYESYKYCTIAV